MTRIYLASQTGNENPNLWCQFVFLYWIQNQPKQMVHISSFFCWIQTTKFQTPRKSNMSFQCAKTLIFHDKTENGSQEKSPAACVHLRLKFRAREKKLEQIPTDLSIRNQIHTADRLGLRWEMNLPCEPTHIPRLWYQMFHAVNLLASAWTEGHTPAHWNRRISYKANILTK